ncbi:MAG: efflux RND transporter periplasmic adaptor subunit [Flavobacteriales bacterium]|nr:efflux RND transporter periplasmic adaptor subunit [Flavobacteriales bacterium]
MRKFILITIIIAAFGGLAYTLSYLYKKNEQKPVVYSTEQAFKTTIINKTVATGSIVPRKEIEIKPQVSGIIEKLYVEAGDVIEKGQLIAKIKIIPNMVNLRNAESRVDRAKIALEDTKLDYDRQKKLFDDGVIAEADFQKFTVAKNRSEEELKSANDNLELIKEGVIKSAGTASNTLIKSTVNGMVLDVPVKEGNSVIESNTFNAGTTISVVADMSSMVFEGKIDESEVGKLKIGMALVLSVGAIENQKFDAKLEYISPKGIEEAGAIQFEIKADVKLKDSTFIRAGYSANGDIVLGKREDVLAIREGLLQFASDSVYVEVETGEQEFDKVIVETGLSDGINIEILSGIDANTLIKGAVMVEGELASESTEKTKKKLRKNKH